MMMIFGFLAGQPGVAYAIGDLAAMALLDFGCLLHI